MDRGGKDGIEHDMRNQDPNNYSSSSISSEWRLCSVNILNTPMSSVDPGNPPAACRENLMGSSSCSSAPMADPFGPPPLWDQPTSGQNMGYCDITLQRNLSTLSPLGCPKVGLGPAAISWNPSVSMLKEGIFLPNAPGILPVSLAQFPADSGFIERAARFSCFSGGGFGDTVNPLGGIDATNMCPRGVVRMPVSMQREVFPIDSVKLLPPQRNSIDTVEASKDAVLSSMPENCEVDQLKTVGRSENLVQSTNEQPKEIVRGSGDDSNQPDFGGGGGQDRKEEKESGSKKRKRTGQDAEFDATVDGQPAENAKNVDEIQQKIDQSPNSASGKAAGKNNKQGSQASEPPKEYIHVRARRGQATNSHSLAERVRREKISERMKFLQDLVPGCSKVTGKAVMLDEIINYVQSLQRQVEFLSMKLATVNPRLDFNIEGLLAKDILHSRAGPSSTLGFFPDMPVPYPPPVHPPSAGLIQAGLNGIGMIPDSLRGNLHNQINQVGGGGSKESAQILNTWEDELNNVVQMGFNGSAPLNSQDNTDGSVLAGHAKMEL